MLWQRTLIYLGFVWVGYLSGFAWVGYLFGWVSTPPLRN